MIIRLRKIIFKLIVEKAGVLTLLTTLGENLNLFLFVFIAKVE